MPTPDPRLRCLPLLLLLLFAPSAEGAEEGSSVKLLTPAPENAKELEPGVRLWVDTDSERVYVDGGVVLREGVLEMFACTRGTKEHESVVAVDCKAMLIHAALLAIGAEPGKPVRFHPEYRPPSGDEIEIGILWHGADGKQHTARAQDWVRNSQSGKAMELPFVFAGSGFRTDTSTGKRYYLAESGDLFCVSNFGTAMLDVPAPSSQSNDALWFEPFTERIPPIGTPVRLVLSVAKKQQPNKNASAP